MNPGYLAVIHRSFDITIFQPWTRTSTYHGISLSSIPDLLLQFAVTTPEITASTRVRARSYRRQKQLNGQANVGRLRILFLDSSTTNLLFRLNIS